MFRRKRFSGYFAILVSVLFFGAQWRLSAGVQTLSEGKKAEAEELERNFLSVPDSARPWVYWWWLNGNVTKESVTWELEEMKKQGIGGVLLFDARGYGDTHIPVPLDIKLEFMSLEWREVVKHAMREASRLGLQMSINLANTGGSLRGPWNMGVHGPKQLQWAAATVVGPAKIAAQLKPRPEKEYAWEVALLAVRVSPFRAKADTIGHSEVDLNTDWQDVQHVLGEGRWRAFEASEIIDLSPHLRGDRLHWEAPPGEWRVIRYNCAVSWTEAQYFRRSAGPGTVDILNTEAVAEYFGLMGNELANDAGPLAGTTLTHFYNVSWEGVHPNWTLGFEKEFTKYRGYDLTPYLPVLAGIIVKDKEVSERFLRDYHRTLSDCFKNNTYVQIGQLSNARGIKWHSENGGPWRDAPMFVEADQLEFWGANDMPQGEFWPAGFKDRDYSGSGRAARVREARSNVRFAAMAAHIYGRPLVSVEAFTHMIEHWSMYPAYLKPFADSNFIDGANLFVWHTFTSSPREIGKPGYEYFAGTHVNPNVTWWDNARAFIDYLARCQYLLQQGFFAADVLAYASNRNNVRWGRGEQWGENPSLKLSRGYAYDRVNTEILVDRLSVEDGELILPGGMRYKLLVVDLEEDALPPQALRKVVDLAKAGATVVLGHLRPSRSIGLADYPVSDQEVSRLAEQLWGSSTERRSRRRLGKGEVLSGISMDEVMKEKDILPDFEGPFEYIHRKDNGLDIFFIAGTGKAECRFRVKGLKPELWDPVSGRARDAKDYRFMEDGRTAVPIELPENGSVFVVFRHPPEAKRLVSATSPAGVIPPMTLRGPWTIDFAPGWGAPETTTFDDLILWNDHAAEGIKYYSGTARYQKSFRLNADQARFAARLNLGKVFNVAQVRLNGKNVGVVWTAPWVVDVTEALREGENQLEVEVTNTWANRLIGDAGLPEDRRYTRANVRLLSDRGSLPEFMAYSAKDPLFPAGLAGPVQIEFADTRQVGF